MRRVILIVLNIFLAITAIAGGIGLVTGLVSPPPQYITGTIFENYLIPGLALLIIVGGVSSLTVISLFLRHTYSISISIISGFSIIIFETVELILVGSPNGIGKNLQIFYFVLGIIIVILACSLRMNITKSNLKYF